LCLPIVFSFIKKVPNLVIPNLVIPNLVKPNLVIPNLVIPNLVMPNLVIHFYSPTLNLPIPYHKQHNLSRKQQFGTKKFNVKTVTPY
jgi:hypothetical protein